MARPNIARARRGSNRLSFNKVILWKHQFIQQVILSDPGLNRSEIRVLARYVDYHNYEEGRAWPTAQSIADDTRMLTETVKETKRALIAKGYLQDAGWYKPPSGGRWRKALRVMYAGHPIGALDHDGEPLWKRLREGGQSDGGVGMKGGLATTSKGGLATTTRTTVTNGGALSHAPAPGDGLVACGAPKKESPPRPRETIEEEEAPPLTEVQLQLAAKGFYPGVITYDRHGNRGTLLEVLPDGAARLRLSHGDIRFNRDIFDHIHLTPPARDAGAAGANS